ncbi:MAG: sigma-54-dependent Fis family transcriptional regulator [Halieaceae bacterium]|nr:sigma-54-dependent Fis family transcriptional regulator [Halieaceae bacterium]
MDGNLHKQHIVRVTRNVHAASADGIADEVIRQSWMRCDREFGLDPGKPPSAYVLDSSAIKEHQGQVEGFLQVARTGMEAFYKQISSLNYVMLLTDGEGVTVDYIGDRKYDREAKQAGLYLGTSWKERYAGTNAVGTCLSTGKAIICHKTDHFYAANIDLTCTAAPIFAPDGNLLAILDVSSMSSPLAKESQFLALQLVMMHAKMIESANFLNHFSSHWILRYAKTPVFVDVNKENLIAIDGDGMILGATQAAVNELNGGCSVKDVIGSSISDYFETSIDDLLSVASGPVNLINNTITVRGAGELFYMDITPPTGKSVSKPKAGFLSGHRNAFDRIAGEEPLMQASITKAKRFADQNLNIIISGETGTGKELMARAIHNSSVRSIKPFVAINCAAIPESLIESELFGYEQGAFTGGRKQGKKGLIMQSDGGTLFLDEISDMPLNLQSRLLRVLAEREVLALGSDKPKRADLHVISASHKDLRVLIARGGFREDLYYRLNGATLELPALRHRQDISFVVANIVAEESKLRRTHFQVSTEVEEIFERYPWPGNCRQLRNVLQFAMALTDDGVIKANDLPDEIRSEVRSNELSPSAAMTGVDDSLQKEALGNGYPMKAKSLIALLQKHKWNITDVALELNLARSTVYRRMKKYAIVAPNDR